MAFVSRAANLDPADPNHVQDIYLRDRGNGTTIVISKGLSSQPANAGSFSPHVSIDGSYVVLQNNMTDYKNCGKSMNLKD